MARRLGGGLAVSVVEGDWRDSALCRGLTEDFFPPTAGSGNRRHRTAVKAALGRCFACPARTRCLEWAVENKEYYGIWGGTTEKERRVMIERGITAAEVVSIVVPKG